MQLELSKIIAITLNNLGVDIVTHVPGSGGTSIYDHWLKENRREDPISFHEEVAYGIAHGAAISGKRSASLIKTHGIVKAGNAVIDALSAEVSAGFVCFVFNDKSGKHSDNIFDVRPFLDGVRQPWHEFKEGNIEQLVADAYLESEQKKMPIVIVIEQELLENKYAYQSLRFKNPAFTFERDITKHMVVPIFADYQYQKLNARLENRSLDPGNNPEIPEVPDGLPPKWAQITREYETLFKVLRAIKRGIVTGDTGVSTLFALPPYDCVDMTTYMGGSIPLAVGALMAGNQKVWALTGDYSFISAGNLGLIEAFQRNLPLKVLIFYNGIAATTGGQSFHNRMLFPILQGYEEFIREINDPKNTCEVEDILFEAALSPEMRIIIADYRNQTED